jgi:hypothetical protein
MLEIEAPICGRLVGGRTDIGPARDQKKMQKLDDGLRLITSPSPIHLFSH